MRALDESSLMELTRLWEATREFVMSLPDQIRKAMYLRAIGLKVRTVAQRLGCSTRTIENRGKDFRVASKKFYEQLSPRQQVLAPSVMQTVLSVADLRAPGAQICSGDIAMARTSDAFLEASEFSDTLSFKLRDVMALRLQGRNTASIAREKGISLRSIENRLREFRFVVESLALRSPDRERVFWLEFSLKLAILFYSVQAPIPLDHPEEFS